MHQVDIEEGLAIAIDAIHADRLTVLCGAGLSMSPPSGLPSAADLARAAKQKYDATYGGTRDPLPAGIEEQAEFFFRRDELATVYLRKLVDQHAFAGRPNAGHEAIADLLLVQGIQTAVSTNVDGLIETAGNQLFGQVGACIDRESAAALPPDVAPLLKVHGCWLRDRDNTVWAPGQLDQEPVSTRISGSADWLRVRLLDRDLLIVGYFTDWDYLNAVLERVLGAVRPSRVVVVDPGETEWLAEKAPHLYAVGSNAATTFCHVKEPGDVFLDRLRTEFSRSFVRRILYAGARAYEDVVAQPVDPAWREPPTADSATLWRIRRDLEGCQPNQPASRRMPAEEPTLGLTIIQMLAKGAQHDGGYWLLDGRRIRVLRAPNTLLHQVEATFAREIAPVVAPDVVIAVGAEAPPVPAHIVRGRSNGTIARGGSIEWLTRPGAVQEMNL